ncbi:hypothetical protein BGZ76_002081 [Entomortierella beljakovae]|nr:hypothetical protein BGZ76_002081 [Entomortierella beljakovae]
MLILQFVTLFSRWRMDSSWAYGVLFILHVVLLAGFVSGRFIQELGEVKLDSQYSYSVSSRPQNASSNAKRMTQPQPKSSETINQPNPRPVLKPSNSFLASSNAFDDAIRSRSGSPEINEINWSPKKPMSIPSSRGAFGMYRDPSQSRRNDNTPQSSNAQPGTLRDPFSQNTDTKFRSRAYEPSPLANPSIVTNMSLSNMSLGEMFGFPSAKFQPPENHFAHRTGSQEARTDPWKFRKADEKGSNLGFGQTITRRARSQFAQDVDDDMDDDDDEDEDSRRLASLGRRPRSPLSMDTDTDNTGNMFSSFGFGATPSYSGSSNSNGKEIFAPQRYFPPEPETGLEDNFFGIVKIVDDYLPPQQGPRSIAGRNLMIKKRMAQRWLILISACRCIALWKGQFGDSSYSWIIQTIYLGVILHATIFWCLDEYRLLHRHLNKFGSEDKKKNPKSIDPFEPTNIDRSCSYILFLMLAIRLINIISWILVDNLPSTTSSSLCSSQGRILKEKCQQPTLMDWSPSIIQWINPDVEGKRAAWSIAYNVGWAHDLAIATLLIALMAFGAGSPTTVKQSSSPEQKVKGRGN